MPIPVQHLIRDQSNLVTVALEADLTDALALMIEHDFSQLPIIDKDDMPLGIITTTGITRALLTFGTSIKELRVIDVFTKPPIFKANEDLLLLLDNLLMAPAAFVVDESSGKLIGIITDYDTTQYFRQRAEDIVLVADIESTLKNHLLTAHDSNKDANSELDKGIASLNTPLDESRKKSLSAIKDYCKNNSFTFTQREAEKSVEKVFPLSKKAKAFDALTMAEYIQFAQKTWIKLGPIFGVSQPAWTEMMDAIREIRNKLVHFRGEVSPVERAKLRRCAEWFQAHQPSQKDASSATDTETIKDEQSQLMGDAPSQPSADSDEPSLQAVSYAKIGQALTKANAKRDVERESYNVYLDTVESLIKVQLPRAAYDHITWWTDDSTRTQQWEKEGWRVAAANLATAKPYVNFRKISPPLSISV